MSDDDKPFACSAPGCGMRFSTEDHLNVHMRKHEMSLALNLGGGGIIASPSNPFLDQTPTPTKFLRNCEEIGLFQELSKNPFEEAFKKAADLPEGVPLPGPHSNDLNTPVPPDPSRLDSVIDVPKLSTSLSIKEESDKDSGLIVIEENEALDLSGRRPDPVKPGIPQPSSTTSDDDIHLRSTSQAADSTMSPVKPIVSSSNSETTSPAVNVPNVALVQQNAASTSPGSGQQVYTMQVYLQLPSGQTVPVNIPATIGPVAQQQQQQQQQQQMSPPGIVLQQKLTSMSAPVPVTTTTATTPTSSMALKQRLKQTLQQNNSPLAVIKTEPTTAPTLQPSVSPSTSSTSILIPETVSTSPLDSPDALSDTDFSDSGKRRKGSNGDDDADERRRKFLERNRAAAARCRQKRKHWINNLEKKADELSNTNSRLQSEVSLLRGEVAQLKTLLLAHKDCPITLQQKSQGHLALTTINLVESGASASVPTITSSEVSASQVAGATDSITMAPGITVIPVSADHIISSQDIVKK